MFDINNLVTDLNAPVSFCGGGGGGGGGDGGYTVTKSTQGVTGSRIGRAVRSGIKGANDIAEEHPGMSSEEIDKLSTDPEANAYGHPNGDGWSGSRGGSRQWDGR